MLHLVIAEHGPETCPASLPELKERVMPELGRLEEVAKGLGVKVEGSWSNMPAHTLYFLVDAPNAHVVNRLTMDLHLIDWNIVTINPVITLQEATGIVEERKPLAA